jgi:hypothetical protein
MKQTTKYVGLDVHQATNVAAVHEESGRVIARSIVPTDTPALLEVRSLGGKRSRRRRRALAPGERYSRKRPTHA